MLVVSILITEHFKTWFSLLIVLIAVACVFPLRSSHWYCLILWENFRKFPPNTKFPENLEAQY